jgi:hypothetical protein
MSKIEVNQISSQCGSTLTIGQSGDSIQLACGATQTGFGRTGTVDWDTTAKTASFTAVSGNGYFVNTTSGAITVTLPAGSAGSIVSLKDYANTWNTNNVTVTPNGTDKINGTNDNATLNTQDQSVTLVYVDSTKGWRAVQDSTSNVTGASFIVATGGTITCCGDYKIHTFTGPGTFTVSSVAPGPSGNPNTLEYIVVGGGGGSKVAGGGAGGFRFASPSLAPVTYPGKPLAAPAGICASTQAYPITVGAGGAGTNNAGVPSPVAERGNNSIFSSITSTGGGAGAGRTDGNSAAQTAENSVNPGGSGGGGYTTPGGSGPAPTGNTPPVSPPQGNNGGTSADQGINAVGTGGGGGAMAVGGNGSTGPAPAGGNAGNGGDGAGIPTAFGSNGVPCGSFRYYAGGGGGGAQKNPVSAEDAGTGGKGGGGTGKKGTSSTAAPNGTANTGGGAGGSGPSNDCNTGGNGGSGIVIIRYKYQ